MKRVYYLMMTFISMFILISTAVAECSDEERINLKNQIGKVIISYSHLGEVVKEDGSIVYNEFMVTTSNIPDGVYIYLYPTTLEKFETLDNGDLKIKLTTGTWKYNFYSSKCQNIIDTISVSLPTFNKYSLDPLCDGIDGSEFKLCGKYYEEEVSRENFEQRLNSYKKIHVKEEKNEVNNDKNNIINSIFTFIKSYYFYLIAAILFIVLISLIVKIISERRNKKVLQ